MFKLTGIGISSLSIIVTLALLCVEYVNSNAPNHDIKMAEYKPQVGGSFSKYAQLTTDDDTYQGFASVTLIDSDNNNIIDNEWQCTMPTSGDQLCVYLTINDTCSGESTISITIDGTISGDVDLFSIFSYHQDSDGIDKYLSFLSDWDGYVGTGAEDGSAGGVFMAPYCGEELFSIDDIFTLLDNVNLYSNTYIRYEPAGGDLDNYELLTSTRVGSASEITFYLINDRNAGTTSVYFSTATITSWVGCAALGDNFLNGSPITVNFFSDQKSTTVGFESFTVELECDAPTSAPTEATPSPTKEAVCNDQDTSYSKSAELTTDNSFAEGFVSANLIDNSNNEIADSQWQCTMPSTGDSMCVYLKINDTCDCESVITITIEGDIISGDVDIFSIFSYEIPDGTDKFVTFATGWNSYFGTGGGVRGGAFIAPHCGDELFSIDDIFTLLDDVNLISSTYIRYEPAGGNLDNYELLTSTTIGNSNPFTLYLVNDRISQITSLYLSSESITTWVGCAALGDEFLYGSEVTVNFFSDQINTEVGFDKFTVDLECSVPTSAPTSVPTSGNGVCNDHDSSYSQYAELTTDDDTYEGFVSASLVDTDNNEIADNQWQCSMPASGDELCVYLTITDTCDCESVITITVEGEIISGDVDIFSIFSYEDSDGTDKFVTFATAWNANFGTGAGVRGGAFIAPHCGHELFSIDDIFTLLDDVNLVGDTYIRYEPAGGNLSNYEWLTDTTIGNSNSFTFYLVNDRVDGFTSLYLSSERITTQVGCAILGDQFLYGSPITVNFFSDQVSTTVGFDKFTVELECTAPTSSQSVMPKLNNTNYNIVYSTILFLLFGGSIVFCVVKQSSDKKFKYQSIPDSQI